MIDQASICPEEEQQEIMASSKTKCPSRPLATGAQILALTGLVLAGGCYPSMMNSSENLKRPRIEDTKKDNEDSELNVDTMLKHYREQLQKFEKELEEELAANNNPKRIKILKKLVKAIRKQLGNLEKMKNIKSTMKGLKGKRKKLLKRADKLYTKQAVIEKCMELAQNIVQIIKEIQRTDSNDKPRIQSLLKKLYEARMEYNRFNERCPTK